MTKSDKTIDIYLEIGQKRVFAGAIDWPGWCRAAKDEDSALQALLDAAPRYAQVLSHSQLGFHAPEDLNELKVAERLKGNTTTDFGAPDMAPKADGQAIDDEELRRLQNILRACWRALGAAAGAAEGKELSKGPRGGGRDLDKIVEHVLGAEGSYVGRLAWKREQREAKSTAEQIEHAAQDAQDALAAAARGEMPKQGPRGGKLWQPRYFVRRSAWHILDHVWEIEDRSA
jgi:hypothetical protein